MYLPKTQEAILGRYKSGMSLQRISDIYGGTAHDIEVLLAHEGRKSVKTTVHYKNDVSSFPTQLFEGFPQDIKTFAYEVAYNYNVPVLTMFMDVGEKQKGILARGSFFYGLNTRFDWSYRKIGRIHKRSISSVIFSIKRYCESAGIIVSEEIRSETLMEQV